MNEEKEGGQSDAPAPSSNASNRERLATPSSGSAIAQLSVKRRKSGKGEHSLPDSHAPAKQANIDDLHPKSDTTKGKRKDQNGDIARKSKGIHRLWHGRERSLGSSPLATAVVNAQSEGAEEAQGSRASGSMGSTDSSSKRAPERIPWTESEHTIDKTSSALGFDADPAQIVTLALSLSESRRRNFSSGGFLLGRDSPSNRRVMSSGSRVYNVPYGGEGGNIKQYLQQQRQGHGSPHRSAGSKRVTSSASPQHKSSNRRVSYLPEAINDSDNAALKASDATLARVEKAREAFELMYEYRRLLQHLPDTLVTSHPHASTRRGSKRTNATSELVVGREYNPLQYIRNRKLRLRERRPIDAEADGWKDIASVRAWVDMVIKDREGEPSPADESHPLPPFGFNDLGPTMLGNLDATSVMQSKSSQNRKMDRPHNDWAVKPWELLADIYWRYQADNLKSIEDPSGRKLFDHITRPSDSPRISKELTRGTKPSESAPLTMPPERQKLRPGKDDRKQGIKDDRFVPEPNPDTGERGRRGRWTKGFTRSRELSICDDSDSEQQRKPRPRDRTGREHMDNLALEKQMMEMLAVEEAESKQLPSSPEQSRAGEVGPQLSSVEASPQSLSSQQSRSPRPRPHRLKTDVPTGHKHFSPPRTSLDDQVMRHRRLSSDDYDTTEPNSSPTSSGFIPSIAINFSPSTSPSKTTASRKRPSTSKLRSFRQSRKPAPSAPAIADHDFATGAKTSTKPSQYNQKAIPKAPNEQSGSIVENANGFLSLNNSKPTHRPSELHESPSAKSLKDLHEPESRLRSFLRAGKVADMVGSQVSRAGDMLWKKERSKDASPFAAPVSSYPSDDSDGGDADVSGFDNTPNDISRVTTDNDAVGQMSRVSYQAERPKYFLDNLPNFKSPAEKRDPSPKSPGVPPERDPISSLQQALKERGRSSRFDRLAPPKIDMPSVSPSPSPPLSPSQRRATDKEASRDSSESRSRFRITSHTRLNDMLGIPGTVGTNRRLPPPTGLATFEAKPHAPRTRPNLQEQRQWSISDRGMALTIETITTRDVARVRALLLTSGVKANEIARRADEVPAQPSKLLQRISSVIEGPLPRTSQAQEHVIAARLLLTAIENNHRALQDAESCFKDTTVKDLASKIDGIDERVNASLTPMVRECADDADLFGAQITREHTLAVKQLSDQVDQILRRRRRRSRWLMRGGWTLLEWVVLGTMWAVWFIVVIVRLVRGTLGLGVRVLRWVFWL